MMWTVAGNVAASDLWLLGGLVLGGLLVAGRAVVGAGDGRQRSPALSTGSRRCIPPLCLLGMLVIGNTPLYASTQPATG